MKTLNQKKKEVMTLLELYEKLCTGEIIMSGWNDDRWVKWGLCGAIDDHIPEQLREFQAVFDINGFLPRRGVMTPERETFLLLFAAYKGEL